MPQFDLIAFDADDTLWHTEHLYADAGARFKRLLSQYQSPEWIEQRLHETEIGNLQHFGYGIKSYGLSMIETAVDLTEGRVTGHDIQELLDLIKQMINAEVRLLDPVADTIEQLAGRYALMLVTKGDLFEQESKITRSGLSHFFRSVEVVSDKTRETYQALLAKHHIAPERFLMVGNSPRSDIWPVLALGAHAVYIPYTATWVHEVADLPPSDHAGYYQLAHLGLLPDLLQWLAS